VPYEAGVLKAVGYDKGQQVNSSELRSAQPPTHIKLTADRQRLAADGQDLSYITVELVDGRGVRHPKAENLVRFAVTGPGQIVGVGNANPVSMESYQRPERKAWQGRCLLIVKSDRRAGQIVVKATATGLAPAEIVIAAR
jgi:beta-galactosidase